MLDCVDEYRTRMTASGEARNLDVWYQHISVSEIVDQLSKVAKSKTTKRAQGAIDKARTRDSLQAFAKLTHVVDGRRRIIADPPLITPIGDLVPDGAWQDEVEEGLRDLIRSYRKTLSSDRRHLLEDFEFVDAARKVVGVGSVGTRAWILLMTGRDEQDPLFLQAKEAQESVLERFAGKSAYANSGQRVVAGQRLMQAASDIFLGWQRVNGLDGITRDFYIRQLRDWKGSADIDVMEASTMSMYARICGATLSRAHARSGDRIAIAAYLGKSDSFDRAMADFATSYADQNERDYQALVDAVNSGRLDALTGL